MNVPESPGSGSVEVLGFVCMSVFVLRPEEFVFGACDSVPDDGVSESIEGRGDKVRSEIHEFAFLVDDHVPPWIRSANDLDETVDESLEFFKDEVFPVLRGDAY